MKDTQTRKDKVIQRKETQYLKVFKTLGSVAIEDTCGKFECNKTGCSIMFWEKSLIFSNNSFSLLSQASLGSPRGCKGYMDITKVITLLISHWLQHCRMKETAGNGIGTPLGPCLPKMDI